MAVPTEGDAVKLNIGCGKRTLAGWFNCDIQPDPEATQPLDLVCDAKAIPLPDGSADEVMAIHVFEHFYRWEAEGVLREWRRLLKPGGKLILELPNLVKCCQNYLDGRKRGGMDPDQLARWGIYGDPRTGNRYMNHPWGYSPEEMIGLLTAAGFRGAVERPTQFHPAGREHRDMRIEATA
jgi:predicted SAM-dependent methyltransferase